jgi:hypothetical protein
MDDMDDDASIQDFEEENKIEDLLNELPEIDKIQKYFQTFDQEIPTEEILTEEQIINMIQADKEDQEMEENENEDEDEEIPPVSVKKALNGLEIFISFFEQQNDVEFNVDDLNFFRRYLRVVRVKEIDSKKQSTLDLFFNNCGI